MPIIRINYAFLVPFVIFTLPEAALFQEEAIIALILILLGSAGTFTGNKFATFFASTSLLGIIVWGKVASDLYHLPGLDSALLLLEFMLVILLMELSNTAISFHKTYAQIQDRNDEISAEYRRGLIEWARIKFSNLATLIGLAFVLSLGLLVVGDLVSISVNQIAFSGILVMIAVVALLILLIHGREPEEKRRQGIATQHPNASYF